MDKNEYIFLSHIMDNNTPSYGNRDEFVVEKLSNIGDGDTVNSCRWTFTNNHLGTHIDLPKHFFETGATVTDYAAGEFIFYHIQLIDISLDKAVLIDSKHLGNRISKQTDLLLIRTGYEKYRNGDKYWNDNPGLAPETGVLLRENFPCLQAVGFDFISLSSWKFRKEGREAHKIFLNPDGPGTPLLVMEDLSLRSVKGQILEVIVAPLRVWESNGAPVTVFALVKNTGANV